MSERALAQGKKREAERQKARPASISGKYVATAASSMHMRVPLPDAGSHEIDRHRKSGAKGHTAASDRSSAHGPRTKPKALAYALPATSGEYVVLYDAEDRPHPLQLVEASQRFRDGGPRLACLQAPLEISNRDQGPMARLFAFEYAALFRACFLGSQPAACSCRWEGTSNHFRRSVLDEIGGWDPYNVTEDADLGLRLARFGYRVETIRCPTYEDAPEDLKTWLLQRTRWFKGWLLTLIEMIKLLKINRYIKLLTSVSRWCSNDIATILLRTLEK